MIQALAQVPRSIRWQWVIYGEGPEGEAMRKAVLESAMDDRIILSPKISHRVLLEQIAEAHVMLVPSVVSAGDEDGIPTVIPEAMLRNTLVVSSAVGAIDELIHDGATGYIVEMANSRKLAAQMESILSQRKDWDKIVSKANDLVRLRYVEQWEFEL